MDDENSFIDVSVISIWEVAVKWALRKGRADDMPVSGENFLYELGRIPIGPLPVLAAHAIALDQLPPIHGDPFDRLLIATARHEGMVLLTHDAVLGEYGDNVLVV
jgi:PIN domain nuclease of toxin-antitoxin system